jgi:hypothetical protein
VWSKACVCGHSLGGVAGSNPAGGLDVCRFLSVICCQVEVSVTGRSLVQRSPTECGLSVCDRGTSVTRQWPISGCRAKEKLFLFRKTGILHYVFLLNKPTCLEAVHFYLNRKKQCVNIFLIHQS